MQKLYAFILGVREFRSDLTQSYEDYELLYAYDCGREFAHKITFRYFEGER